MQHFLALLLLSGVAPLVLASGSTPNTPCKAISLPEPGDLSILSHYSFYRDVNWTLRCYSSITVEYATAWQYVHALAAYYQEYYSFTDMAKDPAATPQSNPLGLKVYNGWKVDLVSELSALASSWKPNTPVPLTQLVFPINDIFNSLRDAHVNQYGEFSDTAYGDILSGHSLSLLDVPRAETNVSVGTVRLSVRADRRNNNKAVVSDSYTKKIINKIAGLSPMTWLRSLLQQPTLQYPNLYKNEGARVNTLLSFFANSYHAFPSLSTGTFDHLADPLHVEYKDGSTTTWQWVINLPITFGFNVTLADLSEQAGQLGIPYMAMNQARAIVAASQKQQELPAALPLHLLSQPPKDRRRLADTAAAEPKLQTSLPVYEYIVNAAGSREGCYGLMELEDGSVVAYWKLTGFANTVEEYASYWSNLVQLAENVTAAGTVIDRLIYDVSSNGGGLVSESHFAMGAMYPELLTMENRFPWLIQYQTRVGPLAKFMVDDKLLYQDQGSADAGFYHHVNSYLGNDSWIAERSQQLNQNRTALMALTALHDALFEAIDVIMQTAASSDTICGTKNEILQTCSDAWNEYYAEFTESYGGQNLTEFFKSNPLDVDAFGALLLQMDPILELFAPYVDQQIPNTNGTVAELVSYVQSDFLQQPSALFTNTTKINRGGVVGEYTARYSASNLGQYASKDGLFANVSFPRSHPFKQVLAVSDGRCGSACAQFTTACWLYSKNKPASGVSFKFMTYGGTGSIQDISPNAFPGGTVIRYDPLSATWAYDGLTYLMAMWIGDASLIAQASSIEDHLPYFASLNLNSTSKYTASLGYQPSLGNATLPMDFYLLPNDHYAPEWFLQTDLDGADLPALYALAAKRFRRA